MSNEYVYTPANRRELYLLDLDGYRARVLAIYSPGRISIDGWFPGPEPFESAYSPASLWWSGVFDRIVPNASPESPLILEMLTRVAGLPDDHKIFQLSS